MQRKKLFVNLLHLTKYTNINADKVVYKRNVNYYIIDKGKSLNKRSYIMLGVLHKK